MNTPLGVPCTNVRTNETAICGRPSDGRPNLAGEPTCPECRAAANAILAATIKVLVRRAAEMDAADAA